MANYASATPASVYAKGGTYNGETGNQRFACVRYADRTTWCSNHSVSYSNTTGLTYANNRILTIDDITTSGTRRVYNFLNYEDYGLHYVRATSKLCCTEMEAAMTIDPNNWGGTCRLGGGGSYSLYYYPGEVVSSNEIPRPTNGRWIDGKYYYTINGQDVLSSAVNQVIADGIEPYVYDNSTVCYQGKTLFRLENHIFLNMNGMNCRNKYFSFIVGADEDAVLAHIRGTQIPSGHQYGWRSPSTPVMWGSGSKSNLDSADCITSEVYNEEEIPPYKSIKAVWVAPAGFTVVFKDAATVNDYSQEGNGREIIVVGFEKNNNNQWNTTTNGFLFEITNFKMS